MRNVAEDGHRESVGIGEIFGWNNRRWVHCALSPGLGMEGRYDGDLYVGCILFNRGA